MSGVSCAALILKWIPLAVFTNQERRSLDGTKMVDTGRPFAEEHVSLVWSRVRERFTNAARHKGRKYAVFHRLRDTVRQSPFVILTVQRDPLNAFCPSSELALGEHSANQGLLDLPGPRRTNKGGVVLNDDLAILWLSPDPRASSSSGRHEHKGVIMT